MFKELFSLSNYYFNPWAFPMLIVGSLMLFQGIFVLLKNKGDRRNRGLFFFNLMTSGWAIFAFLNYISVRADIALIWYKYFSYNFVILSSPALCYFSITWSEYTLNKYKKFVYFFYSISCLSIFLNTVTGHIINGNKKHFFGYYVTFDQLGIATFIFWLIGIMFSLLSFFIIAKKSESAKVRKQAVIMIAAYLIAVTVLVDFLPAFFNYEIYTTGYISMFIYTSFLFYAMIYHKLMDVETIIHKTLAWAATSAFILLPLIGIYAWTLDFFRKVGLIVFVFYSFVYFYILYWLISILQPKIDYIFHRKKFKKDEAFISLVENVFLGANINEAEKNLLKGIYNIFFPKKIRLYIKNETGFALKSNLSDGMPDESPVLPVNVRVLEWLLEKKRLAHKEALESLDRKIVDWFKDNEIEIVVPIMFKSTMLGFLALGKKETLKFYTAEDQKLLSNVGGQIGLAMNNFIQNEKMVEKEKNLNEVLEKEVKERTKELMVKNMELKRFNDIAVDRELKMVELKKEINVLKEKFQDNEQEA